MRRPFVVSEYRDKPLSPRVKLAARLYATAIAPTKKAACEAAGLEPNALSQLRNEPKLNSLIARIDRDLESGVVDMQEVIRTLGRQAVRNIGQIMCDDSVKDEVRLTAARDLADRSPETSKTLKLQTETSLTISDENANLIRSAMLESARARLQYAEAAKGDYITATDEQTRSGLEVISDATNALPPGEVTNAIE